MQKMTNKTHIEGFLYQHNLVKKVTGDKSAHPGTEFITGTVDIATDDAMLNIVQVHFTYVTALTAKNTENATYTILNNIINKTVCSVMEHGIDKASKLRIDSAIGLNEFYTNRNGNEELVSTKRNEGGFVHTSVTLPNEDKRDTFECDMLITKVTHLDGDDSLNMPEKTLVSGYIFDFKNALLPVSFSVTNPGAMNYYESLEVSDEEPIFTKVQGEQISNTIVTTIEEESAFGAPSVREVKRTRKDFVITWGSKEPYLWDDESTITKAELTKGIADRELYLATIKQRQDDYRASKSAESAPSVPVGAEFKF